MQIQQLPIQLWNPSLPDVLGLYKRHSGFSKATQVLPLWKAAPAEPRFTSLFWLLLFFN